MRVDDVTSSQRPARIIEQAKPATAQQSQSQGLAPTATISDQAVRATQAKAETESVQDRPARSAKSQEPAQRLDTQRLQGIATTLQNKLPEMVRASVTFEVKSGNPPVLVIRDQQSGDELRRIPSEDVLQLAEALDDLKGLIVDAKADGAYVVGDVEGSGR